MKKHDRRTVLLLLSAACLLPCADAQDKEKGKDDKGKEKSKKPKGAVISVEVKDKDSQEPLRDVYVFLTVRGTEYERTITSGDDGKAEFKDVPKGTALVQATKDGWKNAGQESALDGNSRTFSLVMEKKL